MEFEEGVEKRDVEVVPTTIDVLGMGKGEPHMPG